MISNIGDHVRARACVRVRERKRDAHASSSSIPHFVFLLHCNSVCVSMLLNSSFSSPKTSVKKMTTLLRKAVVPCGHPPHYCTSSSLSIHLSSQSPFWPAYYKPILFYILEMSSSGAINFLFPCSRLQ